MLPPDTSSDVTYLNRLTLTQCCATYSLSFLTAVIVVCFCFKMQEILVICFTADAGLVNTPNYWKFQNSRIHKGAVYRVLQQQNWNEIVMPFFPQKLLCKVTKFLGKGELHGMFGIQKRDNFTLRFTFRSLVRMTKTIKKNKAELLKGTTWHCCDTSPRLIFCLRAMLDTF